MPEEILRKKIKKELVFLGYNLSYSGTKYLVDLIILLYNNDTTENLNRDFYPEISNKYGKSINTVKNDICNATNLMFAHCSNEKILDYFGVVSDKFKPGPKLVMYTILNKI